MMSKETFHEKLELVKRQLKDSLIHKLKINLINLIEKEIVKSIEETKQTEKADITIDIYALLLELINDPFSQIHYFNLMSSLCTLDNSADKQISASCNTQLLLVLKTFVDENQIPEIDIEQLSELKQKRLLPEKLNPEQLAIRRYLMRIVAMYYKYKVATHPLCLIGEVESKYYFNRYLDKLKEREAQERERNPHRYVNMYSIFSVKDALPEIDPDIKTNLEEYMAALACHVSR